MALDHSSVTISSIRSTLNDAKTHLIDQYALSPSEVNAFDVYQWSDPVIQIFFFFSNPIKPDSVEYPDKSYLVIANTLSGSTNVPIKKLELLYDPDDNSRVWEHFNIHNGVRGSQRIFSFSGPIAGGEMVSVVLIIVNNLGFQGAPTKNDAYKNLHGFTPIYVLDYTGVPGRQAIQDVEPNVP